MTDLSLEQHGSVKKNGKVLVVGGGIAGIQCALDLSQTGFFVYLLDQAPTLGGTMAMLDKTFPTNDCSTCMFSPKLVQVAQDINVEILTSSKIISLEGAPGNFKVLVEKKPRYIEEDKCIACGKCAEKCPKKVIDTFNGELKTRKAAFLTFPQAVPLKYSIDPENCLYLTKGKCGVCSKICPAKAVNYEQKPENLSLDVGAVVISTGFEPALRKEHGEYGFGRYKNVVTSLQYERMLSATGPYEGHPKRPSDGAIPRSIAWIQCVLSRDSARNRPFCSSVCCMHAAKQAILTKTHEPETSAAIYFMDIRAHGKGFDEYIERARYTYGVKYLRSMISQVYLNPVNDNLIIETFDPHIKRKKETEYELVVLSSGLKPTESFLELSKTLGLQCNPYGFLPASFDDPASTSVPGVYVCGAVETPKDIPETVIQAGAAAAETSCLLAEARESAVRKPARFEEAPLDKQPRVGVFVCHCGTNIAGVVDVEDVALYASRLPDVAHADHFMFSCANETLSKIVDSIKEHRLNRIVVAACSPKTHEPIFQGALMRAGLNPYLFELVSIRDQCSWVHSDDPAAATAKAKDLIRAGVARAALLEPLESSTYRVTRSCLVIGGGIAGMSAALAIADQGFECHLVEKEDRLGGFANRLTRTLEDDSPLMLVRNLAKRIEYHPKVKLHLKAELTAHKGRIGNFSGTISGLNGNEAIKYGTVIVATGGKAYEPAEYDYGKDPGVTTQVDLSRKIKEDPGWASDLKSVSMIQCIGSRNEEFPICSRVCCSAAVKNAIELKKLNPDMQVVILYRDMRTFGFKELYYLEARKRGVLFFRYIPKEAPAMHREGEHLVIDFKDRSSGEEFRVISDLLVLSAGIRPSESAKSLSEMLKLDKTRQGFFLEAHVKLRPTEFSMAGFFLAGLAHSPRFIPESIAMAKAAAQQAMKILCKEEISTLAAIAIVNPDRCAACLICVRTCPFGAPFINDQGVSEIPPAQCQGCGICASECPAKAIELKHSTDSQMEARIDALLDAALQ